MRTSPRSTIIFPWLPTPNPLGESRALSHRGHGDLRKRSCWSTVSTVLDIGRLARAAHYSFAGLRNAVRREAAFRQEPIAGAILAPAAMWLRDSRIERAALLGSLMLVLIVKLVSSAIEATVTRVEMERNELSARAKDLASAAVLVNVPLVWGLGLLE